MPSLLYLETSDQLLLTEDGYAFTLETSSPDQPAATVRAFDSPHANLRALASPKADVATRTAPSATLRATL